MSLHKTSILAHPGAMGKALQAYLKAMPEIEVTRCEKDPKVILNSLSAESSDILVIYDEKSEWGLSDFLKAVRQASPTINCIVIIANVDNQKLLLHSGATTVLQLGMLDKNLRSAIINYHSAAVPGQNII